MQEIETGPFTIHCLSVLSVPKLIGLFPMHEVQWASRPIPPPVVVFGVCQQPAFPKPPFANAVDG
jgi:hypothetical protein